MVDQQGDIMEEAIPCHLFDKLKNTIKEGSTYRFWNFNFEAVNMVYRAVDYPKGILFTERIIAIEIKPRPESALLLQSWHREWIRTLLSGKCCGCGFNNISH